MDIKREARKDALRYAKAEMDYGEGAGIKRRHLKAQLGDKFEDPAYKEAFEAALDKIDYDEIVRDVKVKKNSVKLVANAKKLIKTAGVVTPTACGLYQIYKANKYEIDEFFKDIANKVNIKKRREDKKAREKCMEFVSRKSKHSDNEYLKMLNPDLAKKVEEYIDNYDGNTPFEAEIGPGMTFKFEPELTDEMKAKLYLRSKGIRV